MGCQEVEASLMAYLKGGLAPARSKQVADHLAGCDACTRSLQDIQALEAELRLHAARQRPMLSTPASDRIQERVYRRMRRGLIVQRTVKFAVSAAAVAAVVVLVAGALALWQWRQPAQVGPGGQDTAPVGTGTGMAKIPSPVASLADDRINVLLLGIDRRGGTGWAFRTDTIMVATLDPAGETAGLLSIPRDLLVVIPDIGEDRINTVNVYGYLQGFPGGGPALLKRTLAANFGIPVDYYVVVDFDGFVQIVDRLGGIDLDVPRALHDTAYPDPQPDDPYGYRTIHFDPGPQHMDGARALIYARSRMSTSDADRTRRQQQILLAIRAKVLNTTLSTELPQLAATLAGAVETDIPLEELVELVRFVASIDPANLKQVVLEEPFVYSYRRPNGAAVQMADWERIAPVIEELFGVQVPQVEQAEPH